MFADRIGGLVFFSIKIIFWNVQGLGDHQKRFNVGKNLGSIRTGVNG